MDTATTSSTATQRHRSLWIHGFSVLAVSVLFALTGCGGASSDADPSSSDSSSRAKRASARPAITTEPLAISAGDVAVSAYSEAGKLMRADENVGALGNDLFGERVNLYDGSTEFVQTDVSLPGNSALPVSVGRRLATGNAHLVRGHFGDWDLDIPHLHGIFTSDWKVGPGVATATSARCTQFGPPPQVFGQSNQGTFNPVEYWHGSFLYVPGHGSQEILKANTTAAAVNPTGTLANATVTPIKLTTKNRWTLICGPTIRGGVAGNEGFIAISPDGTRYQFDQLVTRPYPQINKPVGTPPQRSGAVKASSAQPNPGDGENFAPDYILKRKETWILPTLITDRFGNQVSYAYEAPGSWRVTSITSTESSGATRTITFQYQADANNPNLVSQVSDGTRTWTYGYADYYMGGTLQGKRLTSVTLPTGGGSWSIDMTSVSTPGPAQGGDAGCGGAPGGQPGGTGTMTHPSGAQGAFKFGPVIHGRSYVVQFCQGNEWEGTGWAYYPLYFSSYAILSKTLSGPGLPAVNLALDNPGGYTWTYKYYDDDVTLDGKASWSTCSGCPDTKTVTVTDPQQVQTRYTFGTRFQATEGQLLQVDDGWNGSSAVRTTIRQYASPTTGPYPSVIGYSVQARTAGDLSTKHAPERLRSIVQQGVTFTWEANTAKFDRLARPTEVTKSSTLGYSRTEQTVYADLPTPTGPADARFTDSWVLGAVSAVNRLTGPAGAFQEEIEGYAFDYTRLKPNLKRSFGRTVQTLSYHSDGNLATRADGLNQTTTFTNYKFGIPRDVSYADGSNEHAEVNNLGLVTEVRNAFGTTTTYEYNNVNDNTGRLTKITQPPEAGMAYYPTLLAFAQVAGEEVGVPGGHWKQTITTGSAVTLRYFDALWRPLLSQTYDASNVAGTSRAILKRFDSGNRITFESYPKRNSDIPSVASNPLGVRRFYDGIGRVFRVEQDSELGVLYTYTNYGGGFTRTVINPRGYSTTTSLFQAYDEPSENQPVTMQLPESVTVGIGRDPFYGKPLTITRAGGSANVTRRYVYDANMRLCKTIEPESGATVQLLDNADNVTWRASGLDLPSTGSCDQGAVPANRKVNFTYTPRNWLQDTTYGDGSPWVSRSYYADGRPLTVATPGASWGYVFNNRRLLTSETLSSSAGAEAFSWGINPYGHVQSLTYPSGDNLTVDYAPNALGQPRQAGGYATDVTYYPNGMVAGYTLGNGIAHSVSQNARGLPEVWADSGVLSDTYRYDQNGNVTEIADGAGTGASRTMPWYDGLDRLRSANGIWGTGNFTYDAVDNLTYSQLTGGSVNRTLTHNIEPIKNRLTGLSGNLNMQIAYDANGNVVLRGAQSFNFDVGNRMVNAPGVVNLYTYDGHGRRLKVDYTNGQTARHQYSLEGELLRTVHSVRGTTKYVYLNGKGVAEVSSQSGTPVYSHTDALGSPVAQTGGSGQITQPRTHYEPYGGTASGTNPVGIGFTGHANDPGTGLVYMQQRYYDPIAGRFLSVDPVATDWDSGSSFNRYVYAENNPFTYIDPDGMQATPGDDRPPPPPPPPPTPIIPLPLPLPIPVPLPIPIPPLPIPSPPVPSVTVTGVRGVKVPSVLDALWLTYQLGKNTPIGLALGAAQPIAHSINETGKGDFWKGLKPYRGKTKTNGKPGKQRRFYEWDHTHGDVEVYDGRGGHLGSVDGNTGDVTKPPVDGRKIDL